jgi:hypothetical protein
MDWKGARKETRSTEHESSAVHHIDHRHKITEEESDISDAISLTLSSFYTTLCDRTVAWKGLSSRVGGTRCDRENFVEGEVRSGEKKVSSQQRYRVYT